MVRLIQQARKEANLNVADRIKLHLRVSEKLSSVVKAHSAYIKEQVLAESLEESDMSSCKFISNDTIEVEEISIGFA